MKLRLQIELLETRRLLAAWQNPVLPLDVDDSGLVTPLDVLVLINEINAGGIRPLHGSPNLNAGEAFWDVDGDGMLSPLDPLTVINALNLHSGPLNAVVAPTADNDPNGNGVVQEDSLSMEGVTTPLAQVKVIVTPINIHFQADGDRQQIWMLQSDSNGQFQFDVELQFGTSEISVEVTDQLGRKHITQREVVRGDFVLDWNAALLNVVRDWTTTSNDPYPGRIVKSPPPVVARNLAMVHLAIYDAFNAGSDQWLPYLQDLMIPENFSREAAATTAAFQVASALYPLPRETAVWQATHYESLRRVPEGTLKQSGIAFGQQVASRLLQLRENDGSSTSHSYVPSDEPGRWNRTAPDTLPPLLPHWGYVQPFGLSSVEPYLAPSPPALDSTEYALAVDEVMRLGGINSMERTNEQSQIALYWADAGGTATPPGHWNRVASRVSIETEESTQDRARTFAMLNMALADAAIVSWRIKYETDLWRPIDAIRRAHEDGNDLTTSDLTWLSFITNPPFPSYTSGHSTFSGAAAEVLTHLFGNDFAFSNRSDGHTGLTQRPVDAIITREFESFRQAAQEASMSRLYGGIHFRFDNQQGLQSGALIGNSIVEFWLNDNQPH